MPEDTPSYYTQNSSLERLIFYSSVLLFFQLLLPHPLVRFLSLQKQDAYRLTEPLILSAPAIEVVDLEALRQGKAQPAEIQRRLRRLRGFFSS